MKKIVFALPLALLATVWARPAHAQGYYTRSSLDYQSAPAYAFPNAAALGPWPWTFELGGGPAPIAKDNGDLKNGYNFTIGGGYNFSPRAGLVLEFMNSGLDVTQQALDNHNNAIDGAASIWSVTLDPIYRFRLAGPVGAYVVGGGGFYEREERFTEPFDNFFQTNHGVVEESGFQRVHDYDDTGGVNVGAGLTWNIGWGTKFFVEGRYHYIFTSGKATQIVPVTIGFRW